MGENGNLAFVRLVDFGAIAMKVANYIRITNLAMYK
jgi:hypothetical protein